MRLSPTASPACGSWRPRIGRSSLKASARSNTSCATIQRSVYARMDRETRDRYRKVIEELARATGQDEQSVARQAIELAQAHATRVALKDGLKRRAPRMSATICSMRGARNSKRDVGYRVPLTRALAPLGIGSSDAGVPGQHWVAHADHCARWTGYAHERGANFLQAGCGQACCCSSRR